MGSHVAKQKGEGRRPPATLARAQQHDESDGDAVKNDWLELQPQFDVPRRLKRRAPSSSGGSTTSSTSTNHNVDADTVISSPAVSLHDFDVLKNIGKGSSGRVYLAQHRESNRFFAMKTLRKRDVIHRKQVDHVWTELRVLKKIAFESTHCPYIVPLRFAFHSKERLFLVFDYCGGGELYFHLGRRGRLPESFAKFYAAEIAVAMGYLHAFGIVFRDLKPENLVLDAVGHVNLIDFGMCKEGIFSACNGVNSFSGTTEYLPPEILTGQESGLSIDWWAFGMILYEMMIGVPPWYDHDREKMVQQILSEDLHFPKGHNLSAEAVDLISALLVKHPAMRLGSSSGSGEILTHPFFSGCDWVRIARRGVEPPFVPPVATGISSIEESYPGICNFDPEFTDIKVAQPPAKDYVPAPPGDIFEGFYFDSRLV